MPFHIPLHLFHKVILFQGRHCNALRIPRRFWKDHRGMEQQLPLGARGQDKLILLAVLSKNAASELFPQ